MTQPRVPIPKPKKLAKPGDPLVLPNGKLVKPVNGQKTPIDVDNIPPINPETFRVRRRKSLKDMPAPTNVMHGIAAVFMYTIFGVGDREVAACLKCSPQDIVELRKHPGYAELFEAVSKTFIDTNSDLIHARIAAMGHSALASIGDISVNGHKDSDRLRASQDILDRGGHISKEMQQRNGMSALRILVVDGSKSLGVDIGGDVNG